MGVCAKKGCTQPCAPRVGAHGRYPTYCLAHLPKTTLWRREQALIDRADRVVLPKVNERKDGPARSWARRGDGYREFVETDWPARIAAQAATQGQAAEALGVSRVAVTGWMGAWKEDLHKAGQAEGWERSPDVDLCLGDTPQAFKLFRDRFFTDRRGVPYRTEWFHLEWIDALHATYRDGGQTAIVSHPRSGKSELLIAFLAWLVCKYPNISIIWIGKSSDLAEKMVGAVMQALEHNQPLIDAVLGPGATFKPAGRSGTKWTRKEFEVATRTVRHKSPTMVGLGVGTTLLGRDADFIVGDDVEDHESTQQPARRASTKLWWSKDVQSRKEEHTGVAYIGSRQHPDDLIGMFLGLSEWKAMVYPAHDPGCHEPWDEEHADRHQSCVLFPAVRSFRWLLKQRRAMGSDALFELNYQNNPKPEGLMVFDAEHIQGCLRHDIALGSVPSWDHRLVAGFDPGGGSGRQAAVLWAVEVGGQKWRLVDLDSTQGGGTVHLRHLLGAWTTNYPSLGVWVFEDNYLKDTLQTDPEVSQIVTAHSLRFVQHHTGANKWDIRHGVYAMAPMYTEKRIELPWAPGPGREKVQQFMDEHIQFDRDAAQNTRWPKPYDLVMAAWFPLKTIRQWQWGGRQQATVTYTSHVTPTLKPSTYGTGRIRRVA